MKEVVYVLFTIEHDGMVLSYHDERGDRTQVDCETLYNVAAVALCKIMTNMERQGEHKELSSPAYVLGHVAEHLTALLEEAKKQLEVEVKDSKNKSIH